MADNEFQRVLTLSIGGDPLALENAGRQIRRALVAAPRNQPVTIIITTQPRTLTRAVGKTPNFMLRQQARALRRIALALGCQPDAMIRAFGRMVGISPATSSRLFNEGRVITIPTIERLKALCREHCVQLDDDIAMLEEIARA